MTHGCPPSMSVASVLMLLVLPTLVRRKSGKSYTIIDVICMQGERKYVEALEIQINSNKIMNGCVGKTIFI
jgi:hypothetical protein